MTGSVRAGGNVGCASQLPSSSSYTGSRSERITSTIDVACCHNDILLKRRTESLLHTARTRALLMRMRHICELDTAHEHEPHLRGWLDSRGITVLRYKVTTVSEEEKTLMVSAHICRVRWCQTIHTLSTAHRTCPLYFSIIARSGPLPRLKLLQFYKLICLLCSQAGRDVYCVCASLT